MVVVSVGVVGVADVIGVAVEAGAMDIVGAAEVGAAVGSVAEEATSPKALNETIVASQIHYAISNYRARGG